MEFIGFLSRLQFGLTASYHIIFPTLLIGLSTFLSFLYWRWLRTNNEVYHESYQLWLRVLLIIYVVGAITGVALSTQIDSVFGKFYSTVDDALTPFRHYELILAVLLEGGSIGVMFLCTRNKRSYKRFAATLVFNFGILVTAFFVISRNSWMNTPAGFEWVDGLAIATNTLDIVFNPSFPLRYIHMITAGLLASAFFVIGISAYQLLKEKQHHIALQNIRFGIIAAAVLSIMQIVIGDLHGLNVYEHQPMKVAALEGHWDTEQGAGFVLFGIPDDELEMNRHEVKIPYALSLLLEHDTKATVKGLKEIPQQDRPNVAISFYSFRIMLTMAFLMLFTALTGLWLLRRGNIQNRTGFLRWSVLMLPSGLLAVITGWTAAETARQPWVVYNMLRTSQSLTADSSGQVMFSLVVFLIGYTLLTLATVYCLQRVINQNRFCYTP